MQFELSSKNQLTKNQKQNVKTKKLLSNIAGSIQNRAFLL